MSEAMGNHDVPRGMPSNSENGYETVEMLKTFRRNDDTFGTCRGDDDVWFSSLRGDSREIANLETAKLAEFKYKNVYSVSVPNGYPALRSSRRAAVTSEQSRMTSKTLEISTNLMNDEKSDETENATAANDLLDVIREYLANYQESNGTPRDEFSFVSLMKMMGRATGESLVALFHIVHNVSPLIQLFLFILRFVLDKLISIRNTGFARQSVVRYAIFGAQLACIYVCLVFIVGFVFMPILHLVLAILAKILLLN